MMATGLICSIRRGQFEAGVRGCGLRPIADVAASMGLDWDALEPYGSDKVKVPLGAFPRTAGDAKLVVVTAITPTPAGEGKTTTSIGLTDGLALLGRRPVLTIRQPSLGPLFGRKGGGTGGGLATVQPAVDINLHFTGDMHAISTANNLLAAMIDNDIYWNGKAGIDPRRISWRRVLDMNDRTFTVHRTAYDIDAAQLATRQAGLPTVLADRLAIGA